MPNNRTRVNYAIYENIGVNIDYSSKTEYCVLCRRNGRMELWGQINVEDTAEAYFIRVQYPTGGLYYGCGMGDDRAMFPVNPLIKREKTKFIRTITFMNEMQKETGRLSFIWIKKEGEHALILESGEKQVLVQKLVETEGFHLEFSDDDAYDDKESPWYFRRFDDPLMAAMIYDEQENMSNKFKERYGVTLPGDIPDELVAMLLSVPFFELGL